MPSIAWSLAHAKLHTFLRKSRLLPRHSRILMAVSGGQDSLCLARLLLDMQHKWQWSLAIAHCDHRWRPDSAKNAAYVSTLAAKWQIPCWTEVTDKPVDSEAAARTWRYKTFARLARAQSYTHVVTGHTASDRAETVLYNLIRGTGLDGIGTLPWKRPLDSQSPPLSLVRPLLAFSRAETLQVCQQQNVVPWEDNSNQNISFRRNRIRRELLPYLREHFNPQVEQALAQTAEVTALDIEYIEAQASVLYDRAIAQKPNSNTAASDGVNGSAIGDRRSWQIDCIQLKAAPQTLQRRALKRLLQTALSEPPNFRQVQQLVDLLDAPNGSQSDPFPGGLTAQVRKPFVLLRFS